MAARIDPFFENQPPLAFIDELRSPIHKEKLLGFGEREPESNETDCRGAYIDFAFPDNEGVLESATEDFKRFSEVFEFGGNKYPIRIEFTAGYSFESYRIIPKNDGMTVLASDTEGVRRAIYYIEDEFKSREGAFFGREEIYRTPAIRKRITRGFFSPTNRPPKNGDELSDDIDYYPEEYLNRIAHDGTNALWIYTSFKALLKSSYIPEYGEGSEKRLEKLAGVVKKCARYGIKVYVFAMEPMNIDSDMARKHPELLGATSLFYDNITHHPICPLSDAGRGYLIEATETLFRTIPDLGGYMCITSGERLTSCASSRLIKTCPRCSKYSYGEALARSIDAIKEGMRRAGTGAEFISWTYAHRLWPDEDIAEYVEKAPNDIMLMQNFDDRGYEEQLGKTREAMDYWLSYVGPSQMFRVTAEAAKKHKKHLYAKMQVCCSHELATVPYIPAPGLIFEKFKGAYECGVEGVLECWYFGNYPSIMSKAAGELSFCHDYSSKEEFIKRLASMYIGKTRADELARSWSFFELGYVNYPINIMFSYYGPMHDGVVWELKLKPADNFSARTWLLLDRPEGDRIHECLWQGHTLEEAITLSERMLENWRIGMQTMSVAKHMDIYTVASVLEVLFSSGLNILRFYKLRDMLGLGEGDAREILSSMKAIVVDEMENSRRAKELCLLDSRLGYHSEAEGFKFFPEKLDSRIKYLEELLQSEFVEVEDRINKGLYPLEFYRARENGELVKDRYTLKKCAVCDAESEPIGTVGSFKASYDDENILLDIVVPRGQSVRVTFEFKLLYPSSTLLLSEGGMDFSGEAMSHQSVFGDKKGAELSRYTHCFTTEGDKTKHSLRISRKECAWSDDKPMRMSVIVGSGARSRSVVWHVRGDFGVYLGKGHTSPNEMGWLLSEKIVEEG